MNEEQKKHLYEAYKKINDHEDRVLGLRRQLETMNAELDKAYNELEAVEKEHERIWFKVYNTRQKIKAFKVKHQDCVE